VELVAVNLRESDRLPEALGASNRITDPNTFSNAAIAVKNLLIRQMIQNSASIKTSMDILVLAAPDIS
jgi:hypothetical protein